MSSSNYHSHASMGITLSVFHRNDRARMMNTPWSVKVSSLSFGLSFSGHSLVYTSLLNPLQFIPRRILFGDGGKNISCTVLCVTNGGGDEAK